MAGSGFWTAMGMETAWALEDEGDVDGRAYQVDGVAGEWGYMRGEWGGMVERAYVRIDASTADVECRVWRYDDLEELQRDEAVYRRVVEAITEEHGRDGGDGASVQDIMHETSAQRRLARSGPRQSRRWSSIRSTSASWRRLTPWTMALPSRTRR